MRQLIFSFILICGFTGCGANEASVRNVAQEALAESSLSESTQAPSTVPNQAASRRVIYEANLELSAQDFDSAESQLRSLINKANGYVADARLRQLDGSKRTGTWTIRIPVENFDSFLAAVRKLGAPISLTQTADDVTNEFVDLESRIENQKKLESRIIELLNSSRDGMKDVIKVEHELARVREAIEVMEGRIRVMRNVTQLATIHLKVTEEEKFVAAVKPEFDQRIRLAWNNSVEESKEFWQNVTVWFVRNGISMVVAILVLASGYFAVLFTLRIIKRIQPAWFNSA